MEQDDDTQSEGDEWCPDEGNGPKMRGVLYEADGESTSLVRMQVFRAQPRDELLLTMRAAMTPQESTVADWVVNMPYSASMPGHGLVFHPDERHVIAIGTSGHPHELAWMDFEQRERNPTWMKPNVDTMTMSLALQKFLRRYTYHRAIDVGAGSGWLAKVLAQHNATSAPVTAVEINPNAVEFMNTRGRSNLPESVIPEEGDAIRLLLQQAEQFDLLVSNPPYVPTKLETQVDHLKGQTVSSIDKAAPQNFFLGTNLPSFVLETAFPAMLSANSSARCVLLLTSASFLSKHLVRVLSELSSHGMMFNVLSETEVHLRYWFFIRTDPENFSSGDYLWNAGEVQIQGHTFMTGITSKPRSHVRVEQSSEDVQDGTACYGGQGWQVVYVLEFYSPDEKVVSSP